MSGRKNQLSLRQLESHLQQLDDFEKPKIDLEQYATPSHVAALILNAIDSDDLNGRLVADLGCGTGRLTVGSLICGAQLVVGFDIDQDALDCALKNISNEFEEEEKDDEVPNSVYTDCPSVNFVIADVASEEFNEFWTSFDKKFDTVIMNPPFGTKKVQGLDMAFLKRAIQISNNVVYSLHKTSTRDYIARKCQQWDVKAKPIAQIRYNLDNTYKFHKKKSVDIDVDLWRIKCCSRQKAV